MLRYLPVVLSLALTIYCVVDAIQSEDSTVRNLPKIVWILLILLFPLVGPAAWLLAGRPPRAVGGGRPRPGTGRPGGRDRRPRGPDDDPDFLKDL